MFASARKTRQLRIPADSTSNQASNKVPLTLNRPLCLEGHLQLAPEADHLRADDETEDVEHIGPPADGFIALLFQIVYLQDMSIYI